MKYLMVLLILLTGCASSPLLPQMQKWETHDQILGSVFIAECAWDAYETNHLFNHPDKFKEHNPYIKNKRDAAVFGTLGMYTGLMVADGFPEIRTPLLGFLCIVEFGGAGLHFEY